MFERARNQISTLPINKTAKVSLDCVLTFVETQRVRRRHSLALSSERAARLQKHENNYNTMDGLPEDATIVLRQLTLVGVSAARLVGGGEILNDLNEPANEGQVQGNVGVARGESRSNGGRCLDCGYNCVLRRISLTKFASESERRAESARLLPAVRAV